MGKIENHEQPLFDELCDVNLSLDVRAIAFRTIMELRSCTARELASLFSVDPRVVVLALSLLELPPPDVKRRSRTRAA